MWVKAAHLVCITIALAFVLLSCVHPIAPNNLATETHPDKIVIRTRILIEYDIETMLPAWDLNKVMQDIKYAEHVFKDLNLKLEIIQIERISEKKQWDTYFDDTNHKYDNCMSVYYIEDKIVIHNEIFVGMSSFPWDSTRKGILVCSGCERPTLAHEIGHYFGLRHTFDPDEDIDDTLNPEQYQRICPGLNYHLYPNLMNYRWSNNDVYVTPHQIEKMRRTAWSYRLDVIDQDKSVSH